MNWNKKLCFAFLAVAGFLCTGWDRCSAQGTTTLATHAENPNASVVIARVKESTNVVFQAEDTYPDALVYDQYDLLYIKNNGADYNLKVLLEANKPRQDSASLDKVLLAARFGKKAGQVLDINIKPGDLVELTLDLFERRNNALGGELAQIQVVDTIGDYLNPLFLAESIKVVKPAEKIKKSDIWGGKNSSNVIVGKSGYLFYAADRFLKIAGTDPVQLKAELPRGEEGKKIVQLRDWLKERGVELVVMIVPVRHSVLTDEFPSHLRATNHGDATYGSVYNDFFQQLGINTIFSPEVFQVPDKSKIYFRTGTHWTYYGAYLYYMELIKDFAHRYPEVKAVKFDDTIVKEKTGTDDIVLAQLETIDDLVQPANEPYCYATVSPEAIANLPGKPSVLMIHDSFGQYLFPFFISSFKNFNNLYVKHDLVINDGMINKFKPDVVLIVYSERYIDSIKTFSIK